MAECSYCAGMPGPRTFEAKAACTTCQRALCDECTHRALCVYCSVKVQPLLISHVVRLRATCVLFENEGHGSLRDLHEALLDVVTRDYARWRLRRPGQDNVEWLRLCEARLLSMDFAPPDLPCTTAAVVRWITEAPPKNADTLVHPQEPLPVLPSDRGRPVLWVPTLVDGRRLANPRECGGCLYHAKGAAAAGERRPLEIRWEADLVTRRERVEQAVDAVRHSEDLAEELNAIREQRRIGETLSTGRSMDL